MSSDQRRNIKTDHGSSRLALRDKLRAECIGRVKRDRLNLLSHLRGIDSQAAFASGEQKMMLLQGFVKDLIADVQSEDADAQMTMVESGEKMYMLSWNSQF